jgi:electron transfer flavoprotein beta subunit
VRILVCVKRVPITGGKMVLTDDDQALETKHLGFTISPHEECGVEEAVRLVESGGGEVVVLTLGPPEAEEQLRDCMAVGADRGILIKTDGMEWDAQATAGAIVDAVRAEDEPFDLILFGNESADSGGFQVGIRTAHALDRPAVTGVKALNVGVSDGTVVARREAPGGGWESFEVPLPAVIAVKEGINLPRYPSVPGRLRAKRKEIETSTPEWRPGGLEKIVLRLPREEITAAEVIGQGADAAPAIVDLLARIGVVER